MFRSLSLKTLRSIYRGFLERRTAEEKQAHRNAWEPALFILNSFVDKKGKQIWYDDLFGDDVEEEVVTREDIEHALELARANNERIRLRQLQE